MIALGIKPDDYIYTQLMLAYAKTKDLAKVKELNKEASVVHKLDQPSLARMNSLLLAYCRVGQVDEAELLIKEMREEMGLEPDAVCYTTLIDGQFKKGNIERCWEIFEECQWRKHSGQRDDE